MSSQLDPSVRPSLQPTAPQPRPASPPITLASFKVRDCHLQRLALVYVRQSTPQQVLNNQESTDRQYALQHRAALLGWPSDRIGVIDEDLGRSGSNAADRPGFQHLLAEVAQNKVGIVLGLEMSRLARSCKDWHQLLEVCAISAAPQVQS
jgi:hypothetical protein